MSKLTRIWLIKGSKIPFPKSWNKDMIMAFINTDIRICQCCGSIDVPIVHFRKCSFESHTKEIRDDMYYK
jgi:hypothetical protein